MCSFVLWPCPMPVRNPTQVFMPVPYPLSSCHYRQFAIICTAFTVLRYKHQLYNTNILFPDAPYTNIFRIFYVAHECQRIMPSHHNDCSQFCVYIISTSNLYLWFLPVHPVIVILYFTEFRFFKQSHIKMLHVSILLLIHEFFGTSIHITDYLKKIKNF